MNDSGIRNLEKLALKQLSKDELIAKVLSLEKKERELVDKHDSLIQSKKESDKQHEELINNYENRLKEFYEKHTHNQKVTEDYKKLVDLKLGKAYNIDATWIDKIVFVLKAAGRPLRSSEIIEVLLKNDVTFRTITNYQKGLSTHLTKALNYGRIIGTKQKGQNGYLFSLPV